MATNRLTATFNSTTLGQNIIIGDTPAPIVVDYLTNFEFSIIADADASYNIASAIGIDGEFIERTDLVNLSGNVTGNAENIGKFAINIISLGTTTGIVKLEIKML